MEKFYDNTKILNNYAYKDFNYLLLSSILNYVENGSYDKYLTLFEIVAESKYDLVNETTLKTLRSINKSNIKSIPTLIDLRIPITSSNLVKLQNIKSIRQIPIELVKETNIFKLINKLSIDHNVLINQFNNIKQYETIMSFLSNYDTSSIFENDINLDRIINGDF